MFAAVAFCCGFSCFGQNTETKFAGPSPQALAQARRSLRELDWKAAAETPGEITVNIAPFARVVSWEPNRKQGARTANNKESHSEDLSLETNLTSRADGSYLVPSYKKRQ